MPGGPLERDTCRDVILPALAAAGWTTEQIRPQFPVKAGRSITLGGINRELRSGVIDYVLEIEQAPVAVVEAKRAYRSAADGMQQAIRYAQQLDAPFAYATNGTEILERDMLAGTERLVEAFADPVLAWSRYAALHGLDDATSGLLHQGFNTNKRTAGQNVQQPRWYQQIAIRRVLAAIARGERRVLLLMATGTGKTFTAMQIVHLLRSYAAVVRPDRNYRVLYLADRDALVESPKDKDFTTAFGKEPLHRVAGSAVRSREIYFATYQALAVGDEDALFRDYPPDFFDLVIVDECHRGSASENSSWRRILDHFTPAIQLGLTATPLQGDTVDTYTYFGDPVFRYSLRQGIEDGYLAPYRVRRVTLSPDADGWEPEPGQLDRYGREIPDGVYSTRDFERIVRLLARTDLAADYLSRMLRRDPTARTMVFCVDAQHADDMRRALVNANPDLVVADPEWVVRIVGVEGEKKRLIDAFTDPERDSPVVATTSRLLSTGFDVQDLKYVVLFRPVGSSVEFKQIIGRGTRLYPDKGKTSFEVIDFVGASAHFADPDFDGYPTRIIHDPPLDPDPAGEGGDEDSSGPDVVAEPEPEFVVTDPGTPGDDTWTGEGDPGSPADPRPTTRLAVDEGDFFVVSEALLVPDTASGRLRLTEYGEFVAGRIRQLATTPGELSSRWARGPGRSEISAALRAAGISLDELLPPDTEDVDPLDFLVQLAWNIPSRTRAERARRVRERHQAELDARSSTAREVLSTLLDLYAEHGIDEMTSTEVLRSPRMSAYGTPRDIARAFGGADAMYAAVDDLQTWIYSQKSVS